MHFQPRQIAITGVERALDCGGFGLLWPPGLGKTSTSLMLIDALKSKRAKGWLVVCPLRPMTATWPVEIEKWDCFNHLSAGILHGPRKGDVLNEKHDIYLINPEGLDWLAAELNKRKAWPFDKLILDESTKFKNPSSKRFQILKQMLPGFPLYRQILTGSLMMGNLDDVWSQIYCLDHGERLGRFVTHFRRRFMQDEAPFGAKYQLWRPKLGAITEVTELISGITMTLDAKDYLTLPKKIVNDIWAPMPQSVYRTYKSLQDAFYAELTPNTSIAAAMGSTKGIKLRQIANGIVYNDQGSTSILHDVKVQALLDLIENQNGEPLLVQCSFFHEVEVIMAAMVKLGLRRPPYLGRGVTRKAADEIVKQWNAGELPVLLANAQSVAHGLNLQAGGNAVCWFSMTYSAEDFDQFNARIYRQGQARPVIIHRLLSKATIDRRLVEVVEGKNSQHKTFLDFAKE